MTETGAGRTYFENSQPILRVADMKASLEFYAGKLGFAIAGWGHEEFTSVNRDKAGIYLCRGGQGLGKAWVWMGIEDVRRFREECRAAGVTIRTEPENYPWALEMHLEDPDGNVLRFGSKPE
jgi:catechol 2,3-dioxygenase-like lactoylglutathione lyase family enzyme